MRDYVYIMKESMPSQGHAESEKGLRFERTRGASQEWLARYENNTMPEYPWPKNKWNMARGDGLGVLVGLLLGDRIEPFMDAVEKTLVPIEDAAAKFLNKVDDLVIGSGGTESKDQQR
jgi:hypothetical protein